MIKMVNWNF